jgi:hypothetical protein
MYMLTQAACWGLKPDYWAIFRPSSYHWFIPALDYPTEVSQIAMTLGALFLVAIVICEFIPALRQRVNWATRAGIYFCAGLIYYVSVSGVARVNMESMLRYEFPVHALIVLAFLNLIGQRAMPSVGVRTVGMAAAALVCATGLGVQGWYVWNFTRGYWVA